MCRSATARKAGSVGKPAQTPHTDPAHSLHLHMSVHGLPRMNTQCVLCPLLLRQGWSPTSQISLNCDQLKGRTLRKIPTVPTAGRPGASSTTQACVPAVTILGYKRPRHSTHKSAVLEEPEPVTGHVSLPPVCWLLQTHSHLSEGCEMKTGWEEMGTT